MLGSAPTRRLAWDRREATSPLTELEGRKGPQWQLGLKRGCILPSLKKGNPQQSLQSVLAASLSGLPYIFSFLHQVRPLNVSRSNSHWGKYGMEWNLKKWDPSGAHLREGGTVPVSHTRSPVLAYGRWLVSAEWMNDEATEQHLTWLLCLNAKDNAIFSRACCQKPVCTHIPVLPPSGRDPEQVLNSSASQFLHVVSGG